MGFMNRLDLIERAGFILWSDEEYATGVVDWSSNYDDEIYNLIDIVINECAKHADHIEIGDTTLGNVIRQKMNGVKNEV